jgi:hypothetical protein
VRESFHRAPWSRAALPTTGTVRRTVLHIAELMAPLLCRRSLHAAVYSMRDAMPQESRSGECRSYLQREATLDDYGRELPVRIPVLDAVDRTR